MNKAANELNLLDTHFVNCHGLMNEKAYSTSADITKLTCIAMNNRYFREIVKKK
jgi:D-alanyl-D-alanine carboxypeptidase